MIKLAPGDLVAPESAPSLDNLEMRRRMALALMQKGQDVSPVGHWTQAAARGLQGIVGALQANKADKQEQSLRGDANSLIASLLGGGSATGGSSPAGAPPAPVVNQAQDALVPQQPMTPEEQGVAKFAAPGLAQSIPQPQIPPDLMQSIKGSEGYSSKPYWDVRQWTNGFGTRAAGPNDVVDQAEAERRLQKEVTGAQKVVKAFAPDAPEGVQKALTSLTYNAGDKWTRSGLGAKVQAGDYAGARERFMQYNKAGGKTLPGLVERRQKEAQWFNGQPQQAEPQAPQPTQVADASGQTLDSATLQRMLANPYTRGMAEKLITKRMAPDESPSSVREWEYYNKLSDAQKQDFLRVKRAEKYLDLGTEYRNPNTGQAFDKNVAEKEKQQQLGEAQGKQIAAAPSDIAAADIAIKQLDAIENDPYLERGTGLSSLANAIPGTGGYDFSSMVDQAKSGAFLTAIQQMRGMGSLSNAEGQTATAAVTRMNTAQSKEGFLSALRDYREVIKLGKERAVKRLGSTAPGAGPSQDYKSRYGLE